MKQDHKYLLNIVIRKFKVEDYKALIVFWDNAKLPYKLKGWINRLVVDPNFRKQSIARMLVTNMENRFSELGINIVACLIENWNTKSMQAFEKLGYNKHSDITYFTKRKNSDV